MSLALTGITGSIIEYALDGLSLRHAALASNIANAGVAGHRPVRVRFEEYLSSQKAALPSLTSAQSPPAPTLHFDLPQREGDRSSLDSDVVAINQNTLQYQALIRGLSKHSGIIASAISEGKR